jgi:transcriptional regulator NrdR family protein
MVCIYCSHKTQIINSRSKNKNISTWRRHKCLQCNSVFTTHESADLEKSISVKPSSGSLRPFLRDQIFIDIYRSVSHRKSPLEDSTHLTDTIISKVLALKSALVSTSELKNIIKETLNSFDKPALAYYSAHFIDN